MKINGFGPVCTFILEHPARWWLSLPPGALRSMPMVFPGLRTMNWTRCWMTGLKWFWCSHFVLWAVLHARQNSLRFFNFQSTTSKKKLKKLQLASTIEYLQYLPMASAAKSIASPICCCYGENRVRTATAREGISSNKLSCKQVMGFATGMPLRLSTVKC